MPGVLLNGVIRAQFNTAVRRVSSLLVDPFCWKGFRVAARRTTLANEHVTKRRDQGSHDQLKLVIQFEQDHLSACQAY